MRDILNSNFSIKKGIETMNIEQELKKKIDLKTKPIGSLGKLEELALKIGKIQNTLSPSLKKPTMLVFAADHGLTAEGVSPFPKDVTYQMVMNFIGGGAAINVFCRQTDIKLKVVDAGVDYDFDSSLPLIHAKITHGTKNIMQEPAMSMEICQQAISKGREIVKKEHDGGCNVIGFGEMGIGNTSAAALLMHKYTGLPIEDCTGRGTGHDDEGLKRKTGILKKASVKYEVTDPLEILANYGGLEIAMMCGAILEAKKLGMLILVDGFISTSAVLAAMKMDSSIPSNLIFTHVSEEKGHRLMLDYLKVNPVLNLGMRLGEGSGVAVTYPIIKSAVAFLNEMASFEDAGVSTQDTH
ncbi:MAG: nicotinate-nucleotide--dimethylbenzimidazole phosphoribosyltransferase [Bacteroidales bacterium]|nr:nicotinate-nucleotide--dimethylbenzimidazole phosphoribosyltransferase [Bacteroidales bacterium]